MARRGHRRVEHHGAVRRHVRPGPADRRGRVAEPGVRVLAEDGRLATGDAVGAAVARGQGTPEGAGTLDRSTQIVSRRPTGECRANALLTVVVKNVFRARARVDIFPKDLRPPPPRSVDCI